MKSWLTIAFTFMTWLALIGASGAVTMLHAEDAIEGHRLFFTEAQRNEAALRGHAVSPGRLPDTSTPGLADTVVHDARKTGASTGSPVKASSIDPLVTRQLRLSMARHEIAENNYRVYFTGLVTGMREARVLVNGLPCEPASAELDRKSDQPVPIDCHGVRNDGLTLSVSTRAGELLVTDSGGRIHRLLPGEGM